jgi:ribosomal protein S27E
MPLLHLVPVFVLVLISFINNFFSFVRWREALDSGACQTQPASTYNLPCYSANSTSFCSLSLIHAPLWSLVQCYVTHLPCVDCTDREVVWNKAVARMRRARRASTFLFKATGGTAKARSLNLKPQIHRQAGMSSHSVCARRHQPSSFRLSVQYFGLRFRRRVNRLTATGPAVRRLNSIRLPLMKNTVQPMDPAGSAERFQRSAVPEKYCLPHLNKAVAVDPSFLVYWEFVTWFLCIIELESELHCDRRSAGQLVLVSGSLWGLWPDFKFHCLTITFFLLYIGHPLWREDGSAICSATTH